MKLIKGFSLIFLGLIIGVFLNYFFDKKIDFTEAKALPSWSRIHTCVEATKEETEFYNLATSSLETAEQAHIPTYNSLNIGATRLLAHGIYRKIDKTSKLVCPPTNLYKRVSSVVTQTKALNYRLEEYQFRLAEKFEHPTPYIVDSIAKVAFQEHPHREKGKDLRPTARTVLASYGTYSSQYADEAYRIMSSDDSLGTSAAQIVAATNYKDSLSKVESMMNELLAKTSEEQTISWRDRRTFYELAYAIYFSGSVGVQHTATIKEFMHRKVESNATMFGYVSLYPKGMCKILAGIHGHEQDVLASYEYCGDDGYPYDR